MLKHRRFAVLIIAVGAGCATTPPADVRVPPELLRGSPYSAAGQPARSRYVVRMTDGQRDWEFQLPELATAYEVRVPLSGKPASPLAIDMATMTSADREILAESQAAQRAKAEAGGGAGDDAVDENEQPRGDKAVNGPLSTRKPTATEAATPPSARPSYLLTLARVKDLYRTRHYELGLVELVELEKQYPDDEHILSMKGSLYERLGNLPLAREAWQQVLRINPFNLAVLEALQRLGK
ncbi:MAG TPA: tetratricopeptide repeat protein [Polyangia bacterium]|nr:tetratricopeptide repeat protein [Polyangia bacterium]